MTVTTDREPDQPTDLPDQVWHDALLWLDQAGVIRQARGNVAGLLGAADKVVGQPVAELIPALAADELAEAAGIAMEVTLHPLDGEPVHGEVRVMAVDESRRLVVVYDLSDREEWRREMRAREQRLKGILATMVDGVLTIDAEGRILSVNPAVARIFGWERTELLGRGLARLLPELLPEGTEAETVLADLAADPHQGGLQTSGMARDGASLPLEVAVARLDLEHQHLYTVIARDISQRKAAEAAMRASRARLEALVTGLPVVLFSVDAEGLFTVFEGRGVELLGVAGGEVVGRSVAEVFASRPDIQDDLRRALTGEELVAERVMAFRVFELRYTPVQDDAGRVTGVLGVGTDISDRVQALRQMRESEGRLRGILDNVVDAIITTDESGQIESFNRAAEKMFGYRGDEVRGRNVAVLMADEDADQHGNYMRRYLESREARVLGKQNREVEAVRKDGTPFPIDIAVSEMRLGERSLFVGIIRDISDRKTMERQLTFLANHDALTHLPNRNLLADRMAQALAYAHRYNQLVAVLLIDLDGFKVINDSLGHPVGDRLLNLVASRLGTCIGETDTVARLGGDEFVILATGVRGTEDIVDRARSVTDGMVPPFEVRGHRLYVTCSVGISVYPRDGSDPESLLRQAEIAMYEAKDQGKNTFRFFTAHMTEAAMERLMIQSELRHALARGQFTLHYQPQVRGQDGIVIGAEALLRWHHPELGMVPPGRFIEIAEETGQIGAIGAWVLRMACRQARAWHEDGHGSLRIAVNLSAKQFQERHLPQLVGEVLEETGLDPTALELELTESVLMNDAEGHIKALRALKDMGVTISIDDFGTGYSSLAYLRRFPIDTLKIDRSFVTDLIDNPDSEAIVDAIVSLARSLKMTIIAEGIETEAQARSLITKGCDLLQGYHLGRPMPSDEFLAHIAPLRRAAGG